MSNNRLKVLPLLFFVLAAIVLSRLFYLQVWNHKFYSALDLGQRADLEKIRGERGEIFLTNSRESHGSSGSGAIKDLAINKDNWLVFAVPGEIKDKKYFVQAVSQIINEPEDFIFSKLNGSDSYAVLKKNIPKDSIEAFKNLKLEGLYWQINSGRYYPQEQLASQVIGFLGGQGHGQYGIEGYYDDIMQGREELAKSQKSFISAGYDDNVSLKGADIFLTIDYNIQFQAESLLEKAKKDIDIDSGQIIVVKPDSGRILSLANYPSFDPNFYSKEKDFDIFQNAAIQKLFEPGSVFKPLTMSMALQEDEVRPETIFIDSGSVKIGPDTIYNFDRKIYGSQTMSGILEKSINTGAVFLSQQINHRSFLSYLKKFSFDGKTGVDLQGEVFSNNEILKKSTGDFTFATAAFGQGIEMTPLQLIQAFSAFANGGKISKPYIVEEIVRGEEIIKAYPEISEPVISAETASQVTSMMINVVDRGFGQSAQIRGYYLAGKTGTAQVPFKDKKGYWPDKTIQSFIGFGPALKPQFLILVKLDNPKVSASALSAAPIFNKLAKFIINYWQIPPDY